MTKFTVIPTEPGWQRIGAVYAVEDDDGYIPAAPVPVVAWAVSTDGSSVGLTAGESVAGAMRELEEVAVAYISPAGTYIENGAAYAVEADWLVRVAARGRRRMAEKTKAAKVLT